jgi:uncharacterized protein YabN with tetrapyrrole methylase and pyrophosphatase domain
MSNILSRITELEKDSIDFGFCWPDEEAIIKHTISECEEIRDAIKHKEPSHRIQEEIGDLLYTAASLCIFAGFDVEDTFIKVADKFHNRMKKLKAITKEHGLDSLQGQSIEFMLKLWDEAKKRD